ncbi:hypothetical protein [Alicyclobacillus fodiniaquatilis]|uniref:Uncharacterized protein n=1 Tax=Alicyclobacillus fodiniaquatilis TaxID=1661150 RepID=A0ABW4JES9_9BACL
MLREFMHPLCHVVSAKTVRFETAPVKQAQIDVGTFPYIDVTPSPQTVGFCYGSILLPDALFEFIKASDQQCHSFVHRRTWVWCNFT